MNKQLLALVLIMAVLVTGCNSEFLETDLRDHDHDGDGVQDHEAHEHDEEHDDEHMNEEHAEDEMHEDDELM